jgi:hypothetical protein
MVRRTWAVRAAWAVLAVAVAGTACGRFASPDEDRAAAPGTTVRYGGGVVRTTAPTSSSVAPKPAGAGAPATTPTVPADAPGTGRVDLAVVDTNGTPRAGVIVTLTGPATRTAKSGAGGKVTLTTQAGDYRAQALEGCSDQLVVVRGGGADLGVAAAQTTTGKLVVHVRLRYEVASPVGYDGDAGWRVGEVHRVHFRLVDPCGDATVPSPAAYTAARFTTDEAVEVVGPLSSAVAPDGTVDIALRCRAADEDVSLELTDALDAKNTTPILTVSLMDEQRPPFCVA